MKKDFDYTSMSTFMTCQRKYDYRINRGIVGKTVATPLDFGKCLHLSLDSWYKDKDVNHAIDIFKENYTESPEDDRRTYRMAEWILRNYHAKYVDQPFKVLSTEQEFTIELPNGNNFIGRIDKVIEWDGAVWGMDHKTTTQLGDTYMRFHTPNLQFSGYTWAIQKLGYPQCQGVLVDAILIAKGLLEGKDGKSLVALRRDFAYRSAGDVGEWAHIVERVQKDIKVKEDSTDWIPNWDACTDYGECPYRKICKEPVEYREQIIKNDYHIEHWDPRGIHKKE